MKLSSFLPVFLAATASAQTAGTTSAFTDSKTGITFQAFSNANYLFGVALDNSTSSTDFIGVIVAKGTGWAGVSLGGAMVGKLLIAAWPSAKTVVASFRQATAKASPPEATGTFTMTPIASGTYVNATHYSYTFLCKACILADGTTFKASDATDTLGFAFSTAAPATPANHASALVHHASDGHFTANIAGAKSAKYDAWAALAVPGQAVTFRA